TRPVGGVRVAAFPRTAAATFTDRRRVVTEASFPADMPYGFGVSTGLVNGAVDVADLQTQAIQSGAQNVSDDLLSALQKHVTLRALGQPTPAMAFFAAAPNDAVRSQEWWLGPLQLNQAWAISRGQGVT